MNQRDRILIAMECYQFLKASGFDQQYAVDVDLLYAAWCTNRQEYEFSELLNIAINHGYQPIIEPEPNAASFGPSIKLMSDD